MLTEFLNKSHSPYQAVGTAIDALEAAGFKLASLSEIGSLPAGNYYAKVHETALFAMRIPPREAEQGAVGETPVSPVKIRIATAHTDFPCFKLKPEPDMGKAANCSKINVEPYGGMLKRTWFDRPLGIAGAVWTRGDDEFNPIMHMVDIDEPVAIIPSLAPHLDREIESKKIDAQKELVPIFSLESDESIMDLIAGRIGVEASDILSTDLNLFAHGDAIAAGANQEFIMSQGIDNMASVAALTQAMAAIASGASEDDDAIASNASENDDAINPAASENRDHISLIALFDNEEIGSRTKQGADSNTLKPVLDQLQPDYDNSFIISVDGAHAVHPNYPEKSDPTSTVELGKGIAIKTSASQRYATDGKMIATIKGICDKHDIPYQVQANRSGAPGGSTLGPIVSAYIPVPAADIGIPMIAMHSACETAAINDYKALVDFIAHAL